MSNSRRKVRSRKVWKVAGLSVKKPYADFPLSPHADGSWAKRINGRLFYFGRWASRIKGKLSPVPDDGWKQALERYKAVADDLYAGRQPQTKAESPTVAHLSNVFLTAKQRQLDAGELSAATFQGYHAIAAILVRSFRSRQAADLGPADFGAFRAEWSKKVGPARVAKIVTVTRMIFKFAFDNDLLQSPVRFGSEFKKPDVATFRRHKAQKPKKMLQACELQTLLGLADVQFRAMILLGLNCGLGNTDVASLPLSAVDLDKGWLEYPRPKTGIFRRCPLWPETVAALREVQAQRREPKAEADGLVFVNIFGRAWIRMTPKAHTDRVTTGFTRLLQQAGLHQFGLGFYTLRHVHRTISDGAKDRVAADVIMGHADNSMAGHYVEQIDDARLVAVAEHVRAWLFAAEKKEPKGNDKPPTLKVFAG